MNGSETLDRSDERPELVHRIAALRILCRGMIIGLLMVTALIVCVVWFALDGQPIAGNAVQIGGISVVTIGAMLTAIFAPVLALLASGSVRQNGIRALVPAEVEPNDRKLLDVYAASKFMEYAILEATAFVNALLYHFTADVGLIVAVCGIAAFMGVRFPTTSGIREWMDATREQISRSRNERLN